MSRFSPEMADNYFVKETGVLFEDRPFFRGISKIFYVTSSPAKIRGLKERTGSYFRGETSLEPDSVGFSGQESDLVRPDRVATDKVLRALHDNAHEFRDHPEYLICAGDVVCWMEQDGVLAPMHNLGRIDSSQLTHLRLINEAKKTAVMLEDGGIVVWDGAFVASRRLLKNGMANGDLVQLISAQRLVVEFAPISSKLVIDIFFENLDRAKNINARIPLIDDPRLQQYIRRIGFLPLSRVVKDYGHTDWHMLPSAYEDWLRPVVDDSGQITNEGAKLLNNAITHVVGNLPPSVDKIFHYNPIRPTNGWIDVDGSIRLNNRDLIH